MDSFQITTQELYEIFNHPAFEEFAHRRLDFSAPVTPAKCEASPTKKKPIQPQEPRMRLVVNGKPLVWMGLLQLRFLHALEVLGFERATPVEILKSMNIQGLKRTQVASHLQKHRQLVRHHSSKLRFSERHLLVLLEFDE